MPRFNQLQADYSPHGLQVLGANYVDSDVGIQNFMTTYSVQYGVASVADSSGYTVPVFSTVFAIDRDGLILWSGASDLLTDQMVENWLGISNGSDGDDDDEGCSTGTSRSPLWYAPIAILAAVLWRRRSGARAARLRP